MSDKPRRETIPTAGAKSRAHRDAPVVAPEAAPAVAADDAATEPTLVAAPSGLSAYRVAKQTDIGKSDHRAMNEDSAGFAYDEASDTWLAFVADGMGGMALGDRASQAAGRSFLSAFPPPDLGAAAIADWLVDRAWAANEAVVQALGGADGGCTFTSIVIRNGFVSVAHVGDTRAYVHDGTVLRRLTRDHSVAEALARSGVATEDEVESSRSQLLRALGVTHERSADYIDPLSAVHPGLHHYRLMPGATIVMCSDGLWGVVDNDTLDHEIKLLGSQPEALADRLVAIALERNTQDNTTAVVIRAPESSPTEGDTASTKPIRSATTRPRTTMPTGDSTTTVELHDDVSTAPVPRRADPAKPARQDEVIVATPPPTDEAPAESPVTSAFELDPDEHDDAVLATAPPAPRSAARSRRSRTLGIAAACSVVAVIGLAVVAGRGGGGRSDTAAVAVRDTSRVDTAESTVALAQESAAPGGAAAATSKAKVATRARVAARATATTVSLSPAAAADAPAPEPVATNQNTPTQQAAVSATGEDGIRCDTKTSGIRVKELTNRAFGTIAERLRTNKNTIKNEASLSDATIISSIQQGEKILTACDTVEPGSTLVLRATSNTGSGIDTKRPGG